MKASTRKGAVVAASAALLTLSTAGWSVPTQATATHTIVGQGAYICLSKPKGLPSETYTITLRISLTAPVSVTPGQTISLSGTATVQFPEKAYQEGKQVGETEADGYSNTLSVATTANGRTTDVAANRWQTPPFPWTDPVVISAPITFHPFTVPANASGAVTLTLPRNERRAPNTAGSSPSTVAFNGVADNKTVLGNVAEDLACYLQGSAPSAIGSIPITSTAPATSTGGSGAAATPSATTQRGTSGSSLSSTSTSAPATTNLNSAADPGSAADTRQAAPADGAAQAAPDSATAITGSQAGGATAVSPQGQLYSVGATRSGVFVSTNLLILAGGLVCFVALSYAFLTQYRLRNLRRAIDDR